MNNLSESCSIKTKELGSRKFQTFGARLWCLKKRSQIFFNNAVSLAKTRKKFRVAKVKLQKAIDEVRRSENALRRQKERLRELADLINEGVLSDLHAVKDKEGGIFNLYVWSIEAEVKFLYSHIEDAERELRSLDDWRRTSAEIMQRCNAHISDASGSKILIDIDLTPKCAICIESSCDCLLVQCKHICMCFSCAKELYHKNDNHIECPICASINEKIIKVYESC